MRPKTQAVTPNTWVTSVRLPLADADQLRAVCAEHNLSHSKILIAGMRSELKRLANKKAAQPAASVEV